ncbi:RNA polymerase sigma-70 factor (ECF subfamily) [Neolewinella xylanilytica]|uniref:RNA polymerase sigma-70 factor (ECF subfamily) n=1 Tax=Neolewinella xylanilytica TaxID=1514080 RepID=A0A2S6I8L3_9BACT|nr:RNA polymerase sigma-70 factor [Neolewinella xylanilytica]PPK87846.1 RNA polymerase sigma-70 factor (ECF subfamily) [Neolewinella xylanilytica]
MNSLSDRYGNRSDEELAALLHRGQQAAFGEIFRRYWKRLYAYAYRIHDREAVCEDIVQEVFTDLWERRHREPIANLEGYLFRATKYSIASHLRGVRFSPAQQEALQELEMDGTVEDKLAAEDLDRCLQHGITELPPRCRRVFQLSRFGHYSNTEIASTLNISIRTVEKHISDAIKQLRSRVEVHHLLVLVISTLA